MDTPSALLAHRGFTHSFLFCILATITFALLAEKVHRPHNIPLARWMIFFGGAIFIHIFIDAFNNYGVGWFEPFSHERVSFNAIYVADPFFSAWPVVACIIIIFFPQKRRRILLWIRAALGLSALYLTYCLVNKYTIDNEVKAALDRQQISYSRYLTTPAPLQNWLWFAVAGNDSGSYIGFHSIFDKEKEIRFQYIPRNDSLLRAIKNDEQFQKLTRFSKGFYSISQKHDTVVFHDLRFGQIIGWENPNAGFVFYYYLQYPSENRLVVQRGRFEGWNAETFISLLKRIAGN